MGYDKLWADLGGRPLIEWSVNAVRLVHPGELVVVSRGPQDDRLRQLAPEARLVPGGSRRRDSVAAGVAATSLPWVAIHDAARPLVEAGLFGRGLAAARHTGAAVPVIPVNDTIKVREGEFVVRTLSRASLVAVQTPQVFRRDLLVQVFGADDADATDEAALVEAAGYTVAVFGGDERNMKVTTAFDLALARLLATQP